MSGSISMFAAFAAGLLSFLSPCVLPLIPGYLSFLTGLTTAELSEESSGVRVVIPALLFVLGFSIVFVALGVSASMLGQVLSQYRDVVEKVAGLVVIAFGLLMLGVIRVPWLYGEARADMGRARSFGRGAAVVMGMAFAAGWTPCIGPLLGTILTLAGSTGDAGRGALLLVAYSLGLGVPFILTAMLFSRATRMLSWFSRNSLTINRTAGALLIGVGVLIFTGQMGVLAAWLTEFLPAVRV